MITLFQTDKERKNMRLFPTVASFSMENPENNASVHTARKQHECLSGARLCHHWWGCWLFFLPSNYSKKKNGNTHNILVIHYKLFTHFFSGENIIQSYSKSLVSNQDPKTWWCYSSHWLPENIHQNILKRALKCVLGRSKKSLHLVKCLPYNLTPWGAAPHSLTSHF